jgi:hypothetical protein
MLLLFLEGELSLLDTTHNIVVPKQIPKITHGITYEYIKFINYTLPAHEPHNHEQFRLLID